MAKATLTICLLVFSFVAHASDTWNEAINAIKNGDGEKAVTFLEVQVSKGDGGAACNLGSVYLTGNGVDQKLEKARNLFRMAIKQGLSCGYFNLALSHYLHPPDHSDPNESVEDLLDQAARENSAIAKNNLAVSYLKKPAGGGRAKKAALLLEEAEVQSSVAKYNLAVVLLESKVPKDKKRAFGALSSLQAENSPKTNLALGHAYEHGLGTSKDLKKAFEYYKKASDAGETPAMINLAVLLANGSLGSQDDAQALTLLEKAAQKGDDRAYIRLGMMYALGRGTAKDTTKARLYYEKAIKGGYADARKLLEELE